jgi:glycosyltransferase involved in cell wall biosynthesis
MNYIYINGRFLTQPLTGVQRYSRELITALDLLIQRDPETHITWTLLCPEISDINLPLRAIRCVTVRGHGLQLWEQRSLAYAARDGALVSLGNSGPFIHRRHFVVLHDASVFRTPGNYSFQYATVRRNLARLLARTAHIGTVSYFSRRELTWALNLRPEAITIIPDGVDHVINRVPDRSVLPRLDVSPGKYLLCVGSPSPNKNLVRAVRAFQICNAYDFKMVIAGGLSTKVFKRGLPELDGNVVMAGHVSDEELVALYQEAGAFVFPSVYEGFGIPPLEAMAHSCLVLASNIEPVREACADAAVYFDPIDVDKMAAVFADAMKGVFDKQALIGKGKLRAAAYSWASSALALRQQVYNMLS